MEYKEEETRDINKDTSTTVSKKIQKEIAELQRERKKFEKLKERVLKEREKDGIQLTYKEICKDIGEEEKTGNAKYSQIKRWKRFIEIEKVKGSHKYIIKEIYKQPLPKESKQNNLYTKIIEILLMYELSEKEEYTGQYTKTNLYYLLGMVNRNFLHKNREQAIKVAKERDRDIEDIKNWEMNHFYLMTTSKLNEIINSALRSMKRRCILDYQEVMMINIEKEEGEDRRGRSYSREATEEEWEEVLEVQKEILLKHGWDKIPIMQAETFYEEVNEELYKRYRWRGAYKEIKLIYTKEYMKSDIPKVLREIKDIVATNQSELNVQILQALEGQIYRLKKKNEEVIGGIGRRRIGREEYKEIREREGFIYPSNYIEHQKKLIELFIKIESESTDKGN